MELGYQDQLLIGIDIGGTLAKVCILIKNNLALNLDHI